MAVVTVSRQFGAGGITLGKMVAESMQYTFADSDIIERIAKEANVSPHWVEAFEKEAGGKLSRFVSKMVSKKLVDRILSDERGYLDEQVYMDYLVLIVAQLANEGSVIIIGRGSQYILNDYEDTYHVLLVDDLENRVKFMIEQHGLDARKAERVVNAEDKRRSNLYKRLGKSNYDDPLLYNLVLNMGRLDLDTAKNMVCNMINSN